MYKTDEQLIMDFLQGKSAAIEELVVRYERPLYFICLRMLENHEDAIEIVQKIFITVLEKLATLHNTRAFKTWLYKIAVNLCHNTLRDKVIYDRALNKLSSVSEQIHGVDPLELEEQTNIIRYYLHKLSDKQKTAVILRIYHNLSYQEIGEILGCQEVTARSHFHLGLKNLASQLKDLIDVS